MWDVYGMSTSFKDKREGVASLLALAAWVWTETELHFLFGFVKLDLLKQVLEP